MTTTIPFGGAIAAAAAKHHLDARLLAAVAAQETGGPGSNGGRNIVGDGGHGRGLFQIDDRYHAFARSARAMDPQANADYAAGMLSGLLRRYGGDIRKALSAYNAGDPDARGTVTQWGDGARLGYADSVLRHYADLGGNLADDLRAEAPAEQANTFALDSLAGLRLAPPPPITSPAAPQGNTRTQNSSPDFASLIDPS